MKADPRYLKALVYSLTGLLIMGIVGQESGKHFFINFTPSEPRGLYLIFPQGTLRRGEIVLVAVPEAFKRYIYGRQWLPAGWPILKEVGALPGDRFCVNGSSFEVLGKPVGKTSPMDSQGLPLPRLQGCFVVRPGSFLPVATHTANSFDGRYMGALPQSQIIAEAKPLITF